MIRHILTSAVLLLLLSSCANMAPLEGGPKDVAPPVLLSSDPPNHSVNFSSDRIHFEFDEYIQLKNAQQKLLISPPMKTPPELREKNKTLTVVFKSISDSNTTYTLNFGDGVSDLNEGNVVPDFTYTFSTGSKADSLMVSGRVINSFTLKPESNFSVFLYPGQGDSLPYKENPYYVARTDAGGRFRFVSMRSGNYSLVAVNDKNNNYRLDPAEESIAFLQETISPFVTMKEDTTIADSLPTRQIAVFGPDTLELFSYNEENPVQKIKKNQRTSRFRADIFFEKTTEIRPSALCLSHTGIKWIHQYSAKNDSLILWAPDTLACSESDTLVFRVTYGYDSLGSPVYKSDTLRIPPVVSRRNSGPQQQPPPLRFSGGSGGKTHPYSRLYFETSSPYKDFNSDGFQLLEMNEDSQFVAIEALPSKDSIHPCRIHLITRLQPGKEYRMNVLPGFVTPIHQSANDSLSWRFSVLPAEDFGNLKITISGAPANSVFVLSDDKDIPRFTWSADTLHAFAFLQPGKYNLMLFADENGNGKRDPGRYLSKRQPEKVMRYEKEISIRANWDLEVTWTLKNEDDD